MRKLKSLIKYFLLSILVYYGFKLNHQILHAKNVLNFIFQRFQETRIHEYEEIISFENFDNVNGTNEPIIPNIVHFLFLNYTEISFPHLINIFAVYLNHKPEFIYFHCNYCSFTGKYFDVIKSYPELWDIIKIYKMPFQNSIFGTKFEYINHHRSNAWKQMLLMHFGGIFLENDVYVVQSLKKYLHFEAVVSWDKPLANNNCCVGDQIYIAHKNARLLKANFDNYRKDFKQSDWNYNAGILPAYILLNNTNLAKIIDYKLGTHDITRELYSINWPEWRDMDAIHLWINHQYYMQTITPKEFDEFNIWKLNFTYAEMCRDILKKINRFIPNS